MITFGKPITKNGRTSIPMFDISNDDEEKESFVTELGIYFPPELCDLIYTKYVYEPKPFIF